MNRSMVTYRENVSEFALTAIKVFTIFNKKTGQAEVEI